MIRFRQGCLTLIGVALVLFTTAFATAGVYIEFHDALGHIRRPHILGLILLVIGALGAFTGAVYMMYLDWKPRDRSRLPPEP